MLAALLVAGIALRLAGLDWGLGPGMYPGEPPYHPDEGINYLTARDLYTAPNAITFTWGGSHYYRTLWLVDQLTANAASDLMSNLRHALHWARGLNVVFTLVTGLFAWHLVCQLCS